MIKIVGRVVICLAAIVNAATAATTRVAVRVRVTADARSVRDSYVALVPEWRPWSAPVSEEITETGEAEFRVATGKYFVVCGARGFEIATHGPDSILAGARTIDVALKPLTRMSGTVYDENGNPLAGVTVADTRATIVPPLDKLSRLAIEQLSADWSAVSGSDGQWTLGFPSEGRVPLVFTANGRAPQWRVYKPGDPPADVGMPKGATLRVDCDRVDPALVVTLEREGPDPSQSIPRTWQPQVWAQWVKATSLTWSSLPPGVYSIYAKYRDPAFFMRRAKKVGKVVLATGDSAVVQVSLPEMKRRGAGFRLLLPDVPAADIDVDDLDAFTSGPDGTRPIACLAESVIGGVVLHMDVRDARQPLYAKTADRFIAPLLQAANAQEPDDPPAPAMIYRRADAFLTLRSAEKDLPLPLSGSAVLRGCGKVPRIEVPVEISKGDVAHLIGPADCAAAVVSFAPFESVVLPKRLRAGEQSLGEFVLHAGSVADVHVTREPGGELVADAAVRVLAAADAGGGGSQVVISEAQTGADGWAHINALPVRRELQFFADAAGQSSVAVTRRGEPHERILIDPISIPKPASLTVVAKIKDSVRSVAPGAKIATIFVEPIDGPATADEKKQQVPADEEQQLRFEPLKPGRWRVAALVSAAGTYALVKVDELDLKPGEVRELDAEVEPLIFHGRVVSGDQGVAARITVENRSVPDIVRQYFVSAADGSFNAVLPSRGTYGAVAVRLDAQVDEIPLDDITFDDPSHALTIVLPSTGTVTAHVSADGHAVPSVMVMASLTRSAGGELEQSAHGHATNEHGDYRFEHLIAGQWTFSVQSPRGSGEKSVIVNGSSDQEITLDLDTPSRLGGIVRDPAGMPVPGARVDCLFIPDSGVPSRSSAGTDGDGKYSVELPAKLSSPAHCSVATPAGLVNAFAAASGDENDVRLPAATAALRIADWGLWYMPESFWLVNADGGVVRIASVAEALGNPARQLQIPALAAGEWKLIRIQTVAQWGLLAAGRAAALPVAADLQLDARSTHTIRLFDMPAVHGGIN